MFISRVATPESIWGPFQHLPYPVCFMITLTRCWTVIVSPTNR